MSASTLSRSASPAPASDRRAGSGRDGSWWRSAVVYQIYPRSFGDGNGDGVGDIPGMRTRLPYLRALGVDAVWISPWYPSPMIDAGYDVADYCDIDPVFGTLADAESFVTDAHAAGIRVIIDLVPNHCSSEHAWFRRALSEGPGSPARERFWFRPGRGENGELPPNDWQSRFGGPAWTRVQGADGPGEWYLHLYAPEQPDLNWEHPDVRADFEDILRFWLDRWHPHRRRRRPGQGAGPAGRRRVRPHQRGAVVGSRWCPRDLPILAAHLRLVWGRPCLHRRDVAAGRRAFCALPAS